MPSSALIVTEDEEEHWEVNDILNSRWYCGRLQYKVKWHEFNRDNKWYYADKGKFEGSENVLNDFHWKYSTKPW